MAASVAGAATDPVRVLVVGQGYVGLQLALRAVEVGDDRHGLRHRRRQGRAAARRPVACERRRRRRRRNEPWPRAVIVRLPTPPASASSTSPSSPSRRRSPRVCPIWPRSGARPTCVGPLVRPGCLVVLESTTYPGTTDELLAPALEAASGLEGRRRLPRRLLARAHRSRGTASGRWFASRRSSPA